MRTIRESSQPANTQLPGLFDPSHNDAGSPGFGQGLGHRRCSFRLNQGNHIATPTGAVIIRFPDDRVLRSDQADLSYLPTPRPNNVWLDWAIGLSVCPGSFFAMLGLAMPSGTRSG